MAVSVARVARALTWLLLLLAIAGGTAWTAQGASSIDFFPLDEAAARTTIAELKLAQ